MAVVATNYTNEFFININLFNMAFADYRGLTPAQQKALREKRNYLAIQLRGLDNDMVNRTEFLWRKGDVRAMKSSYRLPFTEGILEGKICS